MQAVDIQTEQGNYQVIIGYNILSELGRIIDPKKQVLVITDSLVYKLHYHTLKSHLNSHHVITINHPPEHSKTLDGYKTIIDYAYTHQLNRELQVIAFGGGAIGDLAGYFAATYMRGVSFIQVPTTVLAHDSAVGGKVAINHLQVKNLIGSFYQPDSVVYDLSFFNTLNKDQLRSGFAEVIKHSLLSINPFVLETINEIIEIEDLVIKKDYVLNLIRRCIEVKNYYVKTDTYDRSTRHYLNIGHTLAHGLEKRYGLTHGEAVAYGMCFDLYLSNCSDFAYKELIDYFISLGYFKNLKTMHLEALYNIMRLDKKNTNDLLTFVGLERLGKPYIIRLTKEQFFNHMKKFQDKYDEIKLKKKMVIR